MLQCETPPFKEPRGFPDNRRPTKVHSQVINKDQLCVSGCAAIRAVGIHQHSQMSLPTQASSEAEQTSCGFLRS